MVVTRNYLLKKSDGPSAPKLFLDTQVVPVTVNLFGSAEVMLDRFSNRTGIRPSMILASAVGLASIGILRVLIAGNTAASPRREAL